MHRAQAHGARTFWSTLASVALAGALAACGGGGGDGTLAPGSLPNGTLVRVDTLAAGADCANGGHRVSAGVDTNANGTLDADEVAQTRVACSAPNAASLVSRATEPAGANCAQGGQRFSVGLDLDGDQVLDASEVSSVDYVCDTSAAGTRLSAQAPVAAGPECAFGGTRVQVGRDADNDTVLDAGEVEYTTHVCNAAPGAPSTVILQSPEPAGANCAAGGTKIESGPDTNGNTVLDAGEVNAAATTYVCGVVVPTPVNAWSAAALVAPGYAIPPVFPEMATNASGVSYAVWSGLTDALVWSSRRVGAGAWEAPMQVSQVAAPQANMATVAVDAAGNAVAIWQQSSNGGARVEMMASRRTPSGAWDAPVSIESVASGTVGEPRLAINADGVAVAAWYHFDGAVILDVYANIYVPGTGWTGAQVLANGTSLNPQVGVDGDGNAFVAWIRAGGAEVRRYDAATSTWQPVEPIATPGVVNAPRLRVADNGHAVLAWRQGGGTPGVFAQRYVPGTGWSVTATVGTSAPAAGEPDFALAIDAAGNAALAWVQDGASNIRGSIQPAAGAWTAPSAVEQDAGVAQDVRLAIDAGGIVTATWRQSNGDADDARVSRYVGGAWTDPVIVDASGTGIRFNSARVTMDGAGNATALWIQDGLLWFSQFR